MRKTLPCELDEFHAYTNNVFQPFNEEDDDYGSSDSSPTSPRDSQSSDSIIMPVMVTNAITLEEELTNMKVTLERLSKEREEKDAQIKRETMHIVD